MENNKLIAEFMGYPSHIDEESREISYIIDSIHCVDYNLDFHTDWNWLMPVLDKINNSFVEYEHNDKGIVNGLVKGKDGEWVDDRINRVHNAVLQFNIDITYQAVVEFIKWHNLNK